MNKQIYSYVYLYVTGTCGTVTGDGYKLLKDKRKKNKNENMSF